MKVLLETTDTVLFIITAQSRSLNSASFKLGRFVFLCPGNSWNQLKRMCSVNVLLGELRLPRLIPTVIMRFFYLIIRFFPIVSTICWNVFKIFLSFTRLLSNFPWLYVSILHVYVFKLCLPSIIIKLSCQTTYFSVLVQKDYPNFVLVLHYDKFLLISWDLVEKKGCFLCYLLCGLSIWCSLYMSCVLKWTTFSCHMYASFIA